MLVENVLDQLNPDQHNAACMPGKHHTMVLAGAGTGKTRTIVSRAAYLIAEGVPASRIQILAFTRRSAAEIIERVQSYLGEKANGLRASTFHGWCMSLIRRAPNHFGHKGFFIIDQEHQIQLLKTIPVSFKSKQLAPDKISKMNSFSRNTQQPLSDFQTDQRLIDEMNRIIEEYNKRKKELLYLDYDDILEVVAAKIKILSKARDWITDRYDHLLIDEMQDTNSLQWEVVHPLAKNLTLFCVGDDAQSIYGFRGADYENVHDFTNRVSGSVELKLQNNYRSRQEVLDVSNWLLSQSPLNYGVRLKAVNGSGKKPEFHLFGDENTESKWIAESILKDRTNGRPFKENLILVRTGNDGKKIEGALLSKDIPYQFIGGPKLFEKAHIRDILSLLKISANPKDEISWLKFLLLWPGIGKVTATRIIEKIQTEENLFDERLEKNTKIPKLAYNGILSVIKNVNSPDEAVQQAFYCLEDILESKFENHNWEDRQKDIFIIKQLAGGYSSLTEFLENSLLEPVYSKEEGQDDIVTLSTIHSAKGTELQKCYVVNVSPTKYPSIYYHSTEEAREEERRVLYVALTRAQNELIVTGQGQLDLDNAKNVYQSSYEYYFFNNLPASLFDVHYHYEQSWNLHSIDSIEIDYNLLRIICNSKKENHLKIIKPLLEIFINQYDHKIPVQYGMDKKYYCHTDVLNEAVKGNFSWIRFVIDIYDNDGSMSGNIGTQVFLPPGEDTSTGHEICQSIVDIFQDQQIQAFHFGYTNIKDVGQWPNSIWYQFNVFMGFSVLCEK